MNDTFLYFIEPELSLVKSVKNIHFQGSAEVHTA